MKGLRLVSDGTVYGSCVMLGDDIIPGVARIDLSIDAYTKRVEMRLKFDYVEIDVTAPMP